MSPALAGGFSTTAPLGKPKAPSSVDILGQLPCVHLLFRSFIPEALMEPSSQRQALCSYTMWSLPSRDSQSSRVMGCFRRVQGMVGAQREADTLFNKGIL